MMKEWMGKAADPETIVNHTPHILAGRPRSSVARLKKTDSPEIRPTRERNLKQLVELGSATKNASSDPLMFKIGTRQDHQEFRISTTTGETVVTFPKRYYQKKGTNAVAPEWKSSVQGGASNYRKHTKSLQRKPEFVVTNIQLVEKPKLRNQQISNASAEPSIFQTVSTASGGGIPLKLDQQFVMPLQNSRVGTVAVPGTQTFLPRGGRAFPDKSGVMGTKPVQISLVVGFTKAHTKEDANSATVVFNSAVAGVGENSRPKRSQSPRQMAERTGGQAMQPQISLRHKNNGLAAGSVELGPLASRNLPIQEVHTRLSIGNRLNKPMAPGQMRIIEVNENGFGTLQDETKKAPQKIQHTSTLPVVEDNSVKPAARALNLERPAQSSTMSLRPKSRWRGSSGLGIGDKQAEGTAQRLIRKRPAASDRVKQSISQSQGSQITPPSYVCYYFKLATGNNHKLIEKILLNRSWWKKLTTISKGAVVDKPNLYWKMNIDRFDFTSIKENTSGFLTRQAINRFSDGLQISDKDFMFRHMYQKALKTSTLSELFNDIPLTFSFRMDEPEYEQDLQTFCKLFMAVKQNVLPEVVTPLTQTPDKLSSSPIAHPIYYEFKGVVSKGWAEKARASSMPPRSPDSKSQEDKLPPVPKFKRQTDRNFSNVDLSSITPCSEFFGSTFASLYGKSPSILTSSQQTKNSSSKNMWIIKPSECDRGKGVEIFSTLEQLAEILRLYAQGYNMSEYKDLKYSDADEGSPAMLTGLEQSSPQDAMAGIPTSQSPKLKKLQSKKKVALRRPKVGTFPRFVIQKYLEYPALWRGHKFDIRAHALLSQDNKLYVFRDSYIRVCSLKYTLEKQNYFAHLCNTSVNMRSESFGQVAVGNTIGIKDLCQEFEAIEYDTPIGKEIKAKHKTFEEYLFKEICRLIKLAFDAVMVSGNTLLNPNGTPNVFELFGFDIMLTANYQATLIEANFIPGLTDEDNEYLKRYLDRMMDDMFKLTVDELFPAPKQAKRTVETYPFGENDTGENLWIEVAQY